MVYVVSANKHQKNLKEKKIKPTLNKGHTANKDHLANLATYVEDKGKSHHRDPSMSNVKELEIHDNYPPRNMCIAKTTKAKRPTEVRSENKALRGV
jgi:hypothetical protein